MKTIKVKGYELTTAPIRDSFDRRALQFKNKIITSLGRIGLTEDDIDLELEPSAVKNVPAYASWYLQGRHLHYSYKGSRTYAENLYVVFRVIELEVNALLSGQKTAEEFIRDFSEDKDIKDKRKEAREILGVAHDATDLDQINQNYRELAKKHHPDMPEGNPEKFKEINLAHKTLKRELQ